MSMWEPFSERARRAIVLAQEVAQRLGNNFIAADHIVVGIVDAGDNIAVEAFGFFGVTSDRIWQAAERAPGRGAAVSQEMVFTPDAKRLIERAFEESRQLNNTYIGVEHLVLAYTSMDDQKLLRELGIDVAAFRAKVIELLPKWLEKATPQPPPSSRPVAQVDLWNNLFTRVAALQRPGIASAVERESEKRLYYVDTEDLWKRLQACVARRDVIGSLMYAFFIDHREERRPEETFREIVRRMEDNYRR